MNKVVVALVALLFAGMSAALAAQTASPRSEKEKNEIVAVERYFHEGLDGKKFDYFAELFAPDGVQNFPGIPPLRGNTNMVTSMNALLGGTKSFKSDIKAMLVEGNKVMAFIEHTMVQGPDGKFKTQTGVEPAVLDVSGKTIVWKAMALFIFDDNGKVIEEDIMRDDVRIYLQAGAVNVTQ
jgi:hypothetical protein